MLSNTIEIRKETEILARLERVVGNTFRVLDHEGFARCSAYFEPIHFAIVNHKANYLRASINEFLDSAVRFFDKGVELDISTLGAPSWDGELLSFVEVEPIAFKNYFGDLPPDEEE